MILQDGVGNSQQNARLARPRRVPHERAVQWRRLVWVRGYNVFRPEQDLCELVNLKILDATVFTRSVSGFRRRVHKELQLNESLADKMPNGHRWLPRGPEAFGGRLQGHV